VDHRRGNNVEAKAMTEHDYLVLGIAALWIVTNSLGAAFTIRRLYLRRRQSFARLGAATRGDAAAE
jgi:hypothetical protein